MDLPRTLARRYRLDRLIGASSDGDTYLATDLALDRPVAINVLRAPPAGDPQATLRFTREVRAAAAVDHPQVVRVLDAGSDGATRFTVMEAVSGSSLKALVDAGASLPPDQALGLTSQILDGLAAIHDAGIIHGDLTPENVLVDANGRVKLTGFGIVHRATGAGRTGGSTAYLAPEQAVGEPLTPAADLYAVGIILFELLTGRLPFNADHPLGVRYQQVHQPPPSVRAGNPTVPAILDGVVARALAEDPRQRYPSARAMQSALDAIAAAREIRVPPDTRRESPRLAAARRGTARFLVTAAVVVLLLLTSLVVLSLRRSEHGADPAAGPALASSQLVDPRPDRGGLASATPTPTAPAHAAAPPKATAVPTPTPTPTPVPRPTPVVVPGPTRVSPVAPVSMPPSAPEPPPSPHHQAGARGRSGPPPGNATGQDGSPSRPKLPGTAKHHDSSPPSIQPNRHDRHGRGGSHGGKTGHTSQGG